MSERWPQTPNVREKPLDSLHDLWRKKVERLEEEQDLSLGGNCLQISQPRLLCNIASRGAHNGHSLVLRLNIATKRHPTVVAGRASPGTPRRRLRVRSHQQSGTHLAWFRGYDPRIGRWLNADPIENVLGLPGELLPEGPNLYRYVRNDPSNYYDPNGLFIPQLLGALGGAGLDLALQLLTSENFLDALANKDWDRVGNIVKECVDWADVGLSAAGVGLLKAVSKIRKAVKAYKHLKGMSKRHYRSRLIRNKYRRQRRGAIRDPALNSAGTAAALAGKQFLDWPVKRGSCN